MTKFVCNCWTIFNCICDFVQYNWGYLKTEKMCSNEVFSSSKSVKKRDISLINLENRVECYLFCPKMAEVNFVLEWSGKFVRYSVVWQIWKLKLDKKVHQSFVRPQSSEPFKESTDLGIHSIFFFFFSQPCLKPYTFIYIRKLNPNLRRRKTTTQNQEKPLPSLPVHTSQISYT